MSALPSDHIWSVDTIVEIQRRPALRFVHFKKALDEIPGIRYAWCKEDILGEFDYGATFRTSYFLRQNANARQAGEGIVSTNGFVRRQDIEAEIRSSGEAAFSDAPLFSLPQNADAQPIESGLWARIHVHHIGQGDTIVLELPGDELWLLDARFWTTARREEFDDWMQATYPGKQFSRIFISHLHYDHIRSSPAMIRDNPQAEVIVPDSLFHTTRSAQRVWTSAGSRLRRVQGMVSGQFGGLHVEVIHTADVPALQASTSASRDPNDHEVIILLYTSVSAVLLAGDLPGSACNNVLQHSALTTPCQKANRYYKVSHHGSKTGFDAAFFASYPSTYAIISCGQGNSYGHPDDPPYKSNLSPASTDITWKDGQRVYTTGIQ